MARLHDGSVPAWVSSLGGPLILVPLPDCAAWQGAPANYPAVLGDYGLACAVDDYIGLVEFRGHQGLVLGEEPADTIFLTRERVLLRVVSAEQDADVEVVARSVLPRVEWQSELAWDVADDLMLFDSATAGEQALAGEHLIVSLDPGGYTVEAAYVSTSEADLILVRFATRT